MNTKRYFSAQAKAVNEDARTIEVIASTSSVDRDGDVIDQNGWEFQDFLKNPVALVDHQWHSKEKEVGVVEDIQVVNGELRAKIRLYSAAANPLSERILQMALEGAPTAVSVGFLINKGGVKAREGGGRTITSATLVEISFVPIPAQTDAVMRAISDGFSAISMHEARKSLGLSGSGPIDRRVDRAFDSEMIVRIKHNTFDRNVEPARVGDLVESGQAFVKKTGESGEWVSGVKGVVTRIDSNAHVNGVSMGAAAVIDLGNGHEALDYICSPKVLQRGEKVMRATKANPGDLSVGDFVRWDSSGGEAVGRIQRIEEDGTISPNSTDQEFTGTPEDPVALILVYEKADDGYTETDTEVAHLFSTLTKISPLPEADDPEADQEMDGEEDSMETDEADMNMPFKKGDMVEVRMDDFEMRGEVAMIDTDGALSKMLDMGETDAANPVVGVRMLDGKMIVCRAGDCRAVGDVDEEDGMGGEGDGMDEMRSFIIRGVDESELRALFRELAEASV